MLCPHCSQEHPDGVRFCPITGQFLEPAQPANAVPREPAACLNCGAALPSGVVFCPSCGAPQEIALSAMGLPAAGEPKPRRGLGCLWLLPVLLIAAAAALLWALNSGLLALPVPARSQSTPLAASTGTNEAASAVETRASTPTWTRAPVTPQSALYTAAAKTLAVQLTRSAPSSTPTPRPHTATPTISVPTVWKTYVVDAADEVGIITSLAVDASGQVHLAYLDDGHNYLRYVSGRQSQWQFPFNVDTGRQTGNFPSLTLDAFGTPYIAYHSINKSALLLAHAQGGRWSIDQILSGVRIYGLGMCMDGAGHLHMLFLDKKQDQLYYVYQNGPMWIKEYVADSSQDGLYTPILVDEGGEVRIVFYNRGLNYGTRKDGRWTFEVIDDRPDAGIQPALAADSQGNLHVIYYNARDKKLYHVWRDPLGWQTPEAVDDRGDVGQYAALTMDRRDNLHISYYDAGRGALKYAFYSQGKWTIHTVDDANDVGWYTSIGLDGQGNIYISYYDKTAEVLKVAWGVLPGQ